ncbi:lytic transglycosylase domain-containing protein [Odoribacter sp. OttesenSCG-928-J03]|nr:lytic transglycosylase domain-containing protein [Odoribacter sp. OttesenSCG-928-J03]
MKKQYTILYITLTITFLNLLVIAFILRSHNREKTNIGERMEYLDDGIEVPVSFTTDVKLPKQITFAGESVPLNRIDVQESLRKELIVNTYLHSHTIQIMKKAPRIFAIIEPILKSNNIPEDFKYLAVIESSLDPLALSPSGAVGIWQFMEGTAKDFKLEINKEVDERYNIEKATYAATQYLKKAYERFGSWTATAAAYNAGQNMIRKQMEAQKETDYYDLLLGEETERYVFRILALKQIMTHPELYSFIVKDKYPIEVTKKVKVNGPIPNLADFATEHKISYKTLKRFNPWLRKNHLRNSQRKTYEILIPVNTELYK